MSPFYFAKVLQAHYISNTTNYNYTKESNLSYLKSLTSLYPIEITLPRSHFHHRYLSYLFSTRDYHCYCEDGFTGEHCQTDWDECWSGPCQNGATCVDQIADFNCTCPSGLSG